MSIQCEISAIHSPSLSDKNTGLGNVLFQLSTTYGLSKTLDVSASFSNLEQFIEILTTRFNFHHGTTIFRNLRNRQNRVPSKIIHEAEYAFALYDANIVNYIKHHTSEDLQLNGYYQSHLYFHAYREELLKLFSIDDDSMSYIQNKYPILFDTTVVPVSLHFRTNWGLGIFYTQDFCKEAIQRILTSYPTAHFLIFSDNINTIRPILPSLQIPYTIVEGNEDYIDIWTMSLCKHNILSFSTFSWWGAYLNRNKDKTIYYPYDSLRVVYGLQPHPMLTERTTQHYFSEWTPLFSKSII